MSSTSAKITHGLFNLVRARASELFPTPLGRHPGCKSRCSAYGWQHGIHDATVRRCGLPACCACLLDERKRGGSPIGPDANHQTTSPISCTVPGLAARFRGSCLKIAGFTAARRGNSQTTSPISYTATAWLHVFGEVVWKSRGRPGRASRNPGTRLVIWVGILDAGPLVRMKSCVYSHTIAHF